MNKSNFFLLGCTTLLFSIGLLMVFNTTSAEAIDRSLSVNTHHAVLKQIVYAVFSLGFAALLFFFGYHKVLEQAPKVFLILLVSLACVFLKGVGQQINGAYRWVCLGFFSFQPSEFMKVAMPLMFLHFYFKDQKMTWHSFYKIIALFCLPLVLILMQPDNGTVGILLVTIMVLFFLCRIRWFYWLLPALILTSLSLFCALQLHYVRDRIRVYMNPTADLLGRGHQPHQAKIAAGSGRMMGRGVGESVQKLNYLPTARSDYIAAIYAEEFGFLGILLLVLLYMAIAFCGFCNAFFAKDKEGFMVASVLTFLFSLQTFLNLGVVSGLLPSKGTSLPFFSQGGSSLIANSLALSLIIDVARKVKKEKGEEASCQKAIQR